MIKQYLSLASEKFEAMSRREQWLVGLAVPIVIALLMQTLLIDPQLASHSKLSRDLRNLNNTDMGLKAQLTNSPAKRAKVRTQNMKVLAQRLVADLDELDEQLTELTSVMVPANQMPNLLATIMSGHDLTLISLKNLPPEPVLQTGESVSLSNNAAAETDISLYRHSIELTLQGSYLEVLSYLQHLESQPQKVIWRSMAYRVIEHPLGELQLHLQTLSRDKKWLGV